VRSASGSSGSSFAQTVAQGSAFKLVGATFLLGGVLAALFAWYSQIETRRIKRFSCAIPRTVKKDGEIGPAIISNISRSGAKLKDDQSFEPGEKLRLNFVGEKSECRVVRYKNAQMAIVFNELLHSDVLDLALDGPLAVARAKPEA